jgi:hypothetical protein
MPPPPILRKIRKYYEDLQAVDSTFVEIVDKDGKKGTNKAQEQEPEDVTQEKEPVEWNMDEKEEVQEEISEDGGVNADKVKDEGAKQ